MRKGVSTGGKRTGFAKICEIPVIFSNRYVLHARFNVIQDVRDPVPVF
jgi:hypothetical protein